MFSQRSRSTYGHTLCLGLETVPVAYVLLRFGFEFNAKTCFYYLYVPTETYSRRPPGTLLRPFSGIDCQVCAPAFSIITFSFLTTFIQDYILKFHPIRYQDVGDSIANQTIPSSVFSFLRFLSFTTASRVNTRSELFCRPFFALASRSLFPATFDISIITQINPIYQYRNI